jgi:hypothetical protein
MHRDTLGRVVRDAWVVWAKTQPAPKPSWLVPYEALAEPDKEADRQIAEAVLRHVGFEALLDAVNARRLELAERKAAGPLAAADAAEFHRIQPAYFAALDAVMGVGRDERGKAFRTIVAEVEARHDPA